jgi:uncharacterized membrane protein YeaQ/YmgE (transglycosylase-associated protein family)
MVNLVSWCVVGLVAGGLARRVVGAPKRGCLATIVVGILGAMVGGAIWHLATGADDPFDDFDLGSIVIAFLGASGLLLVLEAVGPRQHGRRRR